LYFHFFLFLHSFLNYNFLTFIYFP
jgi:hypothetical protein